jgi:hypothetical protein
MERAKRLELSTSTLAMAVKSPSNGTKGSIREAQRKRPLKFLELGGSRNRQRRILQLVDSLPESGPLNEYVVGHLAF